MSAVSNLAGVFEEFAIFSALFTSQRPHVIVMSTVCELADPFLQLGDPFPLRLSPVRGQLACVRSVKTTNCSVPKAAYDTGRVFLGVGSCDALGDYLMSEWRVCYPGWYKTRTATRSCRTRKRTIISIDVGVADILR